MAKPTKGSQSTLTQEIVKNVVGTAEISSKPPKKKK